MKLVVPTLGAEDLEQLPRRQLKLHQPFAIVNAPKSEGVGKETRGRVQIAGSHARPRIPKHTHWHPPGRTGCVQMAVGASEYHLHPSDIGATEGHDVRGYFQPTAGERNP